MGHLEERHHKLISSVAVLLWAMPEFEGQNKPAACDHQLYLRDKSLNLSGSWVEKHDGNRLKYECGSCGKHYGYAVRTKDEAKLVGAATP